MKSIEFYNPNSFFKKVIEAVDDYCSWNGKKIFVINDKNEAIIQKRSPDIIVSMAKVISYLFVVIPLIMYALHPILHANFKATLLDPLSPNLTLEQKQAVYPFSPNKKIWEELGYPKAALIKHAAAVQFLKETKLLFVIKAYQATQDPILQKAMQFDEDDHPMILCQGEMKRVDTLMEEHGFVFDRYVGMSGCLKDKEGKEWNFISNGGLVQTDWRFKRDAIFYRLSESELKKVQECGKKFDSDPLKTCFLQVYTSKRPVVPNHPVFNDLNDQIPSHVGVRLVLSDGTMYSTGYETPYIDEENLKLFPLTLLTTVPAKPSVRDYDELYPYQSRSVTTIPILPDKMEELLVDLEQLSENGHCRFNHLKMNCLTFATLALKKTGHALDFREYVGSILWNALPNAAQIPLIGKPLNKISKIFVKAASHAPLGLKKSAKNVIRAATYIPDKLRIAMINLFLITLGMNRKSKHISCERSNEAPANWVEMYRFDRGIFWKQLFDEEASRVFWPPAIMKWQKEQASTQVFTYKNGQPSFNII